MIAQYIVVTIEYSKRENRVHKHKNRVRKQKTEYTHTKTKTQK